MNVKTTRVDIKAGFSCNNRCVFCVQGDKRLTVLDRSTAEVRQILQTRSNQAKGVVFTGGEVTLRRDLIDLVTEARALGYTTIQVQTNGRRLSYLPYVQALKAAGVTEFAPALHGSFAALHDHLTRSPGAFHQTVRGIENVLRLGLPVITNSVVVKDNVSDLPTLAQLLCHLGVTQMQFAFVHPDGTANAYFNEVVPKMSIAAVFIRHALDIARAADIPAYTEAVPPCFLQGYETHIAEAVIPETIVIDSPFVIEDYTEYRRTEGKAKGPHCSRCSYDRWCEGPWQQYPEIYGWDEFHPVRTAS